MKNDNENPFIISVVSGKGGVGKTRIATILARVLSENLSKNFKILLIDFDVYNMGLTNLLKQNFQKNGVSNFSISSYLSNEEYREPLKINSNLYVVPAVSLDEESEKSKILSMSTSELVEKLRDFIRDARSNNQVDCIIIDNTGIPDNFSIASSLVADKILLITQSDNVSWWGAINFYHIYLNEIKNGIDAKNKIQFVVNNIPVKYDFEDMNKGTMGVLKNFGFSVFIPFEYGLLESFDENPFENEDIEISTFYKKIKLLSAIILKNSRLENLMSDSQKETYSNKDELNKDFDTKLDRSKRIMNVDNFVNVLKLVFGGIIALYGIIILNMYYGVFGVYDWVNISKILILGVIFATSLIIILMPRDMFKQIIIFTSRKSNGFKRRW